MTHQGGCEDKERGMVESWILGIKREERTTDTDTRGGACLNFTLALQWFENLSS